MLLISAKVIKTSSERQGLALNTVELLCNGDFFCNNDENKMTLLVHGDGIMSAQTEHRYPVLIKLFSLLIDNQFVDKTFSVFGGCLKSLNDDNGPDLRNRFNAFISLFKTHKAYFQQLQNDDIFEKFKKFGDAKKNSILWAAFFEAYFSGNLTGREAGSIIFVLKKSGSLSVDFKFKLYKNSLTIETFFKKYQNVSSYIGPAYFTLIHGE